MSNRASPDLQTFADVARAFVTTIDGRSSKSVEALLTQTEAHLVRLYQAILTVPSDFPGDDRPDNPVGPDPVLRLAESLREHLGAMDQYRVVFDPYEAQQETPVIGSLAEDLAEIYADLRRGLVRWSAGDIEEASYEWRFGFQFHWGRHLLHALHAIFALHFDHVWTVPPFAKRDA